MIWHRSQDRSKIQRSRLVRHFLGSFRVLADLDLNFGVVCRQLVNAAAGFHLSDILRPKWKDQASMALHKNKKGLDVPIAGEPQQTIDSAPLPNRVAIVAGDYHGMKPTMFVEGGDQVRRGQLLFEDKKNPGVRFTAVGGGKIVAINRGDRRALQTVVIELDDDERAGKAETIRFSADTGKHPSELSDQQVRALLIESGLWTALRARPFGRVAQPEAQPRSIFVTAVDSHPLAPDLGVVLAGREDDFERGLIALGKLTDGNIFVCKAPGTNLQVPADSRFRIEEFSGPHPSGTVGYHIHLLDPVDRSRLVWHVCAQDVLAIGKLFAGGELDMSRVVSLAGPPVQKPRLLRTRIGAAISDLVSGEAVGDDLRWISGSVLSGRTANGEVLGYLGRYHQQISVVAEGREREFLGWLAPGSDKFSALNTYVSRLIPGRKFAMTSSMNGSDRAMVPLGVYERVFPLDILPTFVLRSILMRDIERAEALGVLELEEEDLGLCSFVCPGKFDYGVHLRDILTMIEKEG